METRMVIILSALLLAGSQLGTIGLNEIKFISLVPSSLTAGTTLQQERKERIEKKELPQAAQKTIEEEYAAWSVAGAFKLANGEYLVELSKDNKTKELKFDKEGNLKPEQTG